MTSDKNVHADLGETFTADGVTILHGEGKVVLDFKQTAPRIDQVGDDQRQTLVIEHQPIVLQPQAAKILKQVLEDNIENYEEQYGEIETPDLDTESPVETADPEDHEYIG